MDYTLKGAPRLRRDTDANWKAVNPVLADGEQIAIKMTDGSIRYKIGNGSSDYNSLKYFVDQNYIDSKAVAFTVTLSTVGWSENTQAVSDARFLTDGYAYSVAPDSGSFSAYGEAMIYADNVTTAGQMRFHCSEAPSTDLTVNILRIEVSV